MNDWGESVSELVMGKKTITKKLYTVLSYWGVFTFCTCKILISNSKILILRGIVGSRVSPESDTG